MKAASLSFYLAIFGGVALTFGCKPSASGTSDMKSLDNFSSATFKLNHCSGSYNSVVPRDALVASDIEKDVIEATATAVPEELQQAFFRKPINGRVIVSNNFTTDCPESKGKEGDGAVSCRKHENSSVAIVIKRGKSQDETAKNIHHALVRGFGLALVDVILQVNQGSEGTELVENEGLKAVKLAVASDFIDDVLKGKKVDISIFNGMVSPSVFDKTLSKDQREARLKELASGKLTKSFIDNVFAETLDSWYCSVDTRKTLRKDFSQTADTFAEFAAALPEGLSADSSGEQQKLAAPESYSDNGGMALFGRWGGGVTGPYGRPSVIGGTSGRKGED